MTYNGTLSISGGGSTGPVYIGSNAGFNYLLSDGGAGASLQVNSVTWSVVGGDKMYAQNVAGAPYNGSSQVVPNPYALSDPTNSGVPSTPLPTPKFQQTDYQLPAPAQKASSIGFVWGETPSDETIKVTVDISINGVHATPTAERTVHVSQPTLGGALYYLTDGNIKDGEFTYNSVNGTRMSAGKTFPDGSTTKSGTVDGMDFEYLTIPANQGTMAIEQFVTSTQDNYLNTTATPYLHRSGPVYKDPATGATTPEPPNTLDVIRSGAPPTPPIQPWYPYPADSPAVPLFNNYSVNWSISFKDYLMFMPASGGIWVPEASFTWSISAAAQPVGAGTWRITSFSVTPTAPKVDHSTWPQEWSDLAYKYLRIGPPYS